MYSMTEINQLSQFIVITIVISYCITFICPFCSNNDIKIVSSKQKKVEKNYKRVVDSKYNAGNADDLRLRISNLADSFPRFLLFDWSRL